MRSIVRAESPKHLLMIAYHFPPLAGIAGQRALRYARALPACGWRATVVTCDECRGAVDTSILEEHEPFTVVRVPAHLMPDRPYRLMMWLRWNAFLPDEAVFWSWHVVRAAQRVTQHIDAVWSTAMPLSAHVAAARIARERNVPWVADFRDPYVDNPYRPADRLRGWRVRIQDRTLDGATHIATVSPGQMSTLGANAERAVLMPNGWDARDFPEEVAPRPEWPLVLRNIGTLYGRQAKDIPLGEALALARSRLPEIGERMRIEFIGKTAPEVREDVVRRGLDFVTFKPPVPRDVAIRLMREANALLLLNPSDAGNQDVITGKIFEYWAAGRPILALSGEATVAAWIRESGTGTVVPFADVSAIADALCRLAADGPAAIGRPNLAFAARFRSDVQARQLARLLEAPVSPTTSIVQAGDS